MRLEYELSGRADPADKFRWAVRRMLTICFPACCWACFLVLVVSPSYAQRANRTTKTMTAQDASIRSIPFDKMDQAARQKASEVIRKTSIFRQLPRQVIDCDPRYYLFLVRHPEVIVSIWQKMGATDMTFKRTGPEQFYAEDGAGTVGNIEFLFGDHKTHVLYAEGAYTGSLTARPVKAHCLLVLRADYVPHPSGRHLVANQLDVYISIKNIGVELIAKTFRNMIGKATDQNFVETANFVTKLGRTTEKNGPGVQRLAYQLPGLQPNVRQSFAEQAGVVYRKARARSAVTEMNESQTAQVSQPADKK